MVDSVVLKIRRGETPFYARIKRIILRAQRTRMPVPAAFGRVLRATYWAQRGAVEVARRGWTFMYREPVFRSLCEVAGHSLYLEQTPKITGAPRLTIGDRVMISGDLAINAASIFDAPELVVGNDVFLGHRMVVAVAKCVSIGDGALIAPGCFIADFDGHPSDYADRVAGRPTPSTEVRPVAIGPRAWIGRDCMILKGVTVGEGAIVGAGSVVRSDVPPFSIAYGNPAKVVRTRVQGPA